MEPKSYLRLLAKEWKLIAELFEANKSGPIDYVSLTQIVDAHKEGDTDTHTLIEKFIDYGILGQPISGETLYQLGGLTEYEVSHLLQEQRLSLSESIQAYIYKLDDLSKTLLNATNKYDEFGITDGCKKMYQQIQDIKHQIHSNLLATINIVAQAKKSETAKPLRQRYADVISAWDQYIKPMGDMVDITGAFDATIDSSVGRMEQATNQLEASGALISEVENVQLVRQMLHDMRSYILTNFQQARDILKPLYEVARLNSKVTRGASILIESIHKSRFNEINHIANFELYRKPRMPLVSKQSALMKYYYGYREIKNSPPPTIPSPSVIAGHKSKLSPPFDIKPVLQQLKAELPINDIVAWAIKSFPDIPTDHVLDIVQLCYSEKSLTFNTHEHCTHKTITHGITANRIVVEETYG